MHVRAYKYAYIHTHIKIYRYINNINIYIYTHYNLRRIPAIVDSLVGILIVCFNSHLTVLLLSHHNIAIYILMYENICRFALWRQRMHALKHILVRIRNFIFSSPCVTTYSFEMTSLSLLSLANFSCCHAIRYAKSKRPLTWPLTSTTNRKWLHQRRQAQPIGSDTPRHGRAGEPNCDAALPSCSSACHYGVRSIGGTQHRPRALVAPACL